MTDPQVSLDALQDTFDTDEDNGYRGARVDFHPNSAYSQETDPTTSPRAPRYTQINIDEYADPDNPDIASIYGRAGITDAEATTLNTQTITDTVPAVGAAVDQTTDLDGEAEFDGTVTGVTITPVSTITGDGTNNRTFKVRNKTADHALFTVTTTATKTGGAASALVADGSDQSVSQGDEFEVVETHGGTGVANPGASFAITILATDG